MEDLQKRTKMFLQGLPRMDTSDFHGDSGKHSEYFHNTNAVVNILDLLT